MGEGEGLAHLQEPEILQRRVGRAVQAVAAAAGRVALDLDGREAERRDDRGLPRVLGHWLPLL